MPDSASPKRSFGPRLLLMVAVPLLLLAALEGLCSLCLFVIDIPNHGQRPMAERHHTEYDAELGWIHRPSVTLEDLYGPGRTLTVNSQRVRAKRDYATQIPAGKGRIVCSGDSFTLGYGVDDEEAWCRLLETRHPNLEVINMGQGGYGIDQAYLWYQRDGQQWEHQVHLFAFIYDDFQRMRKADFSGYGKPRLTMQDGVPVATDVPVAERSFASSWVSQNHGLLRRLSLVDAGWRLVGPDEDSSSGPPPLEFAEMLEVALGCFQSLQKQHVAANRTLVAVWLPTRSEHRGNSWDTLRQNFLAKLRGLGIATIDLVPDYRALEPLRMSSLFLAPGEVDFAAAEQHYSAKGNKYVARRIATELAKLPPFAEWLSDQ